MINKIAFLLITLILVSANVFATPPEVFPGGPYTGYRNTNIDLNGSATNEGAIITSLDWSLPIGSGCTIVEQFVKVDQNRNDAVITCTDVKTIDVNLTVENNNGERTSKLAQLEISNQQPEVDLLEDVTTGTPPLTVTFTGFCSDLDGNGTINTCFLDYGDGEGESVSGPPYYFTKPHEYSAEGTYYPKLMANDDQDVNESDTDTIYVDNMPPTTTASGIPSSWSNSSVNVTLSCTDSGGSTCAATTYRVDSDAGTGATMGNWTAYATLISFSAEGTWALDFNSTDSVGNIESTKRATILIDKGASAPSISTSVSDDDVTISWSAVSDSFSGIDCYEIRRSTSSGFDFYGSGVTTVRSCSSQGTSTSYTNSNLSDDTWYYRVKAVDNAGNEAISSAVSAVVDTDDEDEEEEVDDTPPELFWELPSSNNRDDLSGSVTLKVQAYDDESGVRFVQFRVDDMPIETDYSASAERYTVTWDSENVVDGEHTLKAIAKNRSTGNDDTRIKTIRVTTKNGISDVPTDEGSETDAKKAIDEADDLKEEAAKLFEELQEIGFSPGTETVKLLSDASDLLTEAEQLFDDQDYNVAETKAAQAKEKFDGLVEMLSIEEYGEQQEYVFNDEHLELLLKGLGFSQGLVDEVKEMVEDYTVGRSLSVKAVKEKYSTSYRAVITVTVKNDSGEAKQVKVIEVIPKELAENASLISGEGFEVVVEDPVLQWQLQLEAGEEAEIVYFLKDDLTAEQANELLESAVLSKFAVPPVLAKPDTEIAAESFSGAAAGLFGLGAGLEWLGWIVLAVIVVLVALLAFNYLRGMEREGSGLAASMPRTGPEGGFFGRLRSGKREEESKGPKWQYRG